MELIEKLEELFESTFETNRIAHHKISFINSKPPILEVCIELEDGSMDLDTCEIISKSLSDILDSSNLINNEYNLDVCSFGAERELEIEELSLYLNSYVHIEYKNPKHGLDAVEGNLTMVNDKDVSIKYLEKGKEKTAVVELDNIKLARLAVKI